MFGSVDRTYKHPHCGQIFSSAILPEWRNQWRKVYAAVHVLKSLKPEQYINNIKSDPHTGFNQYLKSRHLIWLGFRFRWILLTGKWFGFTCVFVVCFRRVVWPLPVSPHSSGTWWTAPCWRSVPLSTRTPWTLSTEAGWLTCTSPLTTLCWCPQGGTLR